jgi:hypothetical protein
MGWGQTSTDCFLFGTCKDQTTHPEDGRLYEKVCPKKPELPITMHAKMCDPKDKCDKFAKEWFGDGMCDWETCGNCKGMWKGDTFDGGDCKNGEVKLTAMVTESKMSVSDVVVYGFAALGLGTMLFGSYRFYCNKQAF